MLALLWPRFELILEMNVQSVRSTDPQRLGGLDTRPHYVREGKGNKGVPKRQGSSFTMGVGRVPSCVVGLAGYWGTLCVWGSLGVCEFRVNLASFIIVIGGGSHRG